jgi:hypothetical protein
MHLIKPNHNQMKKLSFIIVLLIFLLSCEKDDNTCNSNDPLKDLAWLHELTTTFTNCSCEMSIIQATYNRQTVFYTAMTDPLCNGNIQTYVLFDCTGNAVKSYQSGDQAMEGKVTNLKVIYRCKT